MNTLLLPLVVSFGLVLLYPILAAAMLRATEGVRSDLAELGKELLAAPQIKEPHKQLISEMLDDVFDWRFMAYATVVFPVLVVRTALGKERLSSEDKAFAEDPKVRRFFDLHMKATSAAAPFWTVLFYIVAIVTLVFAIAFIGVSIISQIWTDTVQHVAGRVGSHPELHRASNGQ